MDWHGWIPAPGTPGATITKLAAGELPDGQPDGQKVRLAPGQSVVGVLPGARVASGQWATAKFHLASTSTQAVSLRVLLARDSGEGESFFKSFVKVTQDLQLVRVSGKFLSSHASLRLELKNAGVADAEFVVGRPTVRIA